MPTGSSQRTHHLATRPGIDSCKKQYGFLAKHSTSRLKNYIGHPLERHCPSSTALRVLCCWLFAQSYVLVLISMGRRVSVFPRLNALERLPVRLPCAGQPPARHTLIQLDCLWLQGGYIIFRRAVVRTSFVNPTCAALVLGRGIVVIITRRVAGARQGGLPSQPCGRCRAAWAAERGVDSCSCS